MATDATDAADIGMTADTDPADAEFTDAVLMGQSFSVGSMV